MAGITCSAAGGWGTARWFESLGMRPGALHASTASVTELGAGVLLVLGLVTPFAGAAVVGLMVVALVTNHLRNGFFIFRPGEGYDYVLVLIAMGVLLTPTGGGDWSGDAALHVFDPPGWRASLLALLVGFGGAAGLLAVFWQPTAKAAVAPQRARAQVGARRCGHGQAVPGRRALGSQRPRHVVGLGQSQSAGQLVGYINDYYQRDWKLFDALNSQVSGVPRTYRPRARPVDQQRVRSGVRPTCTVRRAVPDVGDRRRQPCRRTHEQLRLG
jgi:putative oxidoreductase